MIRVVVGGSWKENLEGLVFDNWNEVWPESWKRGRTVELGVMIVDMVEAKKLNWDYRRRDYVPQVLAFPTGNREADLDGVYRPGDVVICGPLLVAESKQEKVKVEDKIKVWLKHGIGNLVTENL